MWGFLGQTLSKDPKELVRNWQTVLRKENRQLDRQIQLIEREEEKTKQMLKEAVRNRESDVCRLLAREIVRAHKAVSRIYSAKAKLMSVECNINQQLAAWRLSGSMQQSAEVMKTMQELIKVSDVAESMRELSKEMMKAGVIEETLEEAFGEVEGEEDLEEEVQKEVDKVLWDLTAGQLGKAPDAVKDPLPGILSQGPAVPMETENEDRVMQARLEALRS